MNKKMTNRVTRHAQGVRLLGGVVTGVALGVATGILLAPESGKKVRKDIKKMSGDFYQYLAPRIEKIRHIGKAQYQAFITGGAKEYARLKNLSLDEQNLLLAEAKRSWRYVREQFQ